ncbi:hypothetical protein GCM10007391_05470 [Alteromonas halophila]|uniref:Ribose-phosphate pyrophosphokinase n=1 Tax=Alteromonas halophila TaxID=516698 RepID=A0A918MVS1_9ALTE|nr:hypothetical protein GCM10007391_05470 [Alteromonas halophila]
MLATGCNDESEAPDTTEAQQLQTDSNVSQQGDTTASTDEASAREVPERVKELASQKPIKEQSPMQTTTVTGTITYKDLEGGFYALITSDGQRFLLQDLDVEYQKHGMVAKVTGIPHPNMRTIQQFGTPFEVSSVEIVDDSKVEPKNRER